MYDLNYEYSENMSLSELVNCCVMDANDGDIIHVTFQNDGIVRIELFNMYLRGKGSYIIGQNGVIISGKNPVVKLVDIDLQKFIKDCDGNVQFKVAENGIQSTFIG